MVSFFWSLGTVFSQETRAHSCFSSFVEPFQLNSDLCVLLVIGAHSQDYDDLLQSLQNSSKIQGYSIQERQGLQTGSGSASLRCQVVRIRRPDQAHLQEEGQANQEDHPQTRLPKDQGRPIESHRQMQDFRARRRSHQEQGRPPLLSHLTLLVKHSLTGTEMSYVE